MAVRKMWHSSALALMGCVLCLSVLQGNASGDTSAFTRATFDAADLSINNGDGYKDWDNSLGAVTWSESSIMRSYLTMYRATSDTYYLDKLIDHADSVLATRDDFASSSFEAPGNNPVWSFGSNPVDYLTSAPLTSGQIIQPMVRFSRLVSETSSLASNGTYVAKAATYMERAEETVDWLDDHFIYDLSGGRSAYRRHPGGNLIIDATHVESTMGSVLVDMFHVTGDANLRVQADRLATTIRDTSLYTTPQGNLAWTYEYNGPSDADDISHASYAAPFIAEMIQDDRIFSHEQGRLMAKSLIEEAYLGDGQVTSGMDGSAQDRVGTNPWSWSHGMAGGLIQLAQFDLRLLPIAEAVFLENYPNAPEVYGWQEEGIANLVRYNAVPQVLALTLSVAIEGKSYQTQSPAIGSLLDVNRIILVNQDDASDVRELYLHLDGSGDEWEQLWELNAFLDSSASRDLIGGQMELTVSSIDGLERIKEIMGVDLLSSGWGADLSASGSQVVFSGQLQMEQLFGLSINELTVVPEPAVFVIFVGLCMIVVGYRRRILCSE